MKTGKAEKKARRKEREYEQAKAALAVPGGRRRGISAAVGAVRGSVTRTTTAVRTQRKRLRRMRTVLRLADRLLRVLLR